MVNLYQGQRHAGMTMIVRCVSCRKCCHHYCLVVTRDAVAADYHELFISHFSLTCPLIKSSVRRILITTIVFDELVVKGEQAAIRGAVCVITCCAVTLISSNSNDTASATGSAEASQFVIGCIAT